MKGTVRVSRNKTSNTSKDLQKESFKKKLLDLQSWFEEGGSRQLAVL